MSERISNINSISSYQYNRNSSSDTKNFYSKNEKSFEDILNEEIEEITIKPKIKQGVSIDNKYKELYTKKDKVLPFKIKYCVIPVYYTNKNQIEEEIVGYIVSKCFLVSKKEIYLPNNTKKEEYEVVCPYNTVTVFYEETNLPIFDNDKCLNSIVVDKLFDNYKYAKDECFIKNRNLDKSTIELLELYEEFVFQKTKKFQINKENQSKILTYNTK